MMDAKKREKARRRLLDEIKAEARSTKNWTGRAEFSDRVTAAMAKVERHLFVPVEDVDCAYINRPRPIGHGQTISQPYIVAVMTDLLDLDKNDRVLEIGAGSGYQAAVLAEVAGYVYSIETVEALAASARRRLKSLGYANIEIRCGDGYQGWEEQAPFDAVIVTAAPEYIPQALIEQLKVGGRMVIPVGRAHDTQILYRGVKEEDGTLTTTRTLPVAFVPMVSR